MRLDESQRYRWIGFILSSREESRTTLLPVNLNCNLTKAGQTVRPVLAPGNVDQASQNVTQLCCFWIGGSEPM
jgi:hypothetical protein